MKLTIMATFIEAKPFIILMPLSSINQTPFPAFRLEDKTLVISGMGIMGGVLQMSLSNRYIYLVPYGDEIS